MSRMETNSGSTRRRRERFLSSEGSARRRIRDQQRELEREEHAAMRWPEQYAAMRANRDRGHRGGRSVWDKERGIGRWREPLPRGGPHWDRKCSPSQSLDTRYQGEHYPAGGEEHRGVKRCPTMQLER